MIYFNYNGKVFKEQSPVVGPDNRGLRYGDGLFETMKMKKGRIIFEDEHFARLWKGLEMLKFDLPGNFTTEKLLQEIIALAKKNNHYESARVRLNIIRGDGGLFDAKSHAPNYIIQTWALADSQDEMNSNGLVLGIYEGTKKNCDVFSNLKHNNYLPYVMGALHAKKERWNDSIVLNIHDRICDATIANIFIVKDDVVYTPPLSEGCVAGVMRKILLKNLLNFGWEIKEKELITADILNADEVFLTNSISNIRWVQRVGDATYQNTITQKIFTDLHQTFS